MDYVLSNIVPYALGFLVIWFFLGLIARCVIRGNYRYLDSHSPEARREALRRRSHVECWVRYAFWSGPIGFVDVMRKMCARKDKLQPRFVLRL